MYDSFRQTPASSCSSAPVLPARQERSLADTWRVGSPSVCSAPRDLVRERACGWQQLIGGVRGKEKKYSQWEQCTPSYAVVLERFTSLKTIQHFHFTVDDTVSSLLRFFFYRELVYLPLYFKRGWRESYSTWSNYMGRTEEIQAVVYVVTHTAWTHTRIWEQCVPESFIPVQAHSNSACLLYTKYTQVN